MKYLISFSIIFLIGLNVSAQNANPVNWTFEVEDKGDQVHEIYFKADLENTWAIYSQDNNGEGPIPTSFSFDPNDDLTLEEGVREKGDLISGFDEMFETTVSKFKKNVDFVQTVKLKSDKTVLKGYVTYMVCNDNKCLPPTDHEFQIAIN